MMVFFCRSQSLRQLRVESQRVDGHGAGELKVLTSVVASTQPQQGCCSECSLPSGQNLVNSLHQASAISNLVFRELVLP